MAEFQELIKDAPKFDLMERGELVAYAYGMFAAGTKANAENAKLRELVRLLLWGVDNDMPRYEEMAWTQKVNALVRDLGVEVDG